LAAIPLYRIAAVVMLIISKPEHLAMNTNQQIAATILEQLGGRGFRMMTGAKDFVAAECALHFRLPSNFAKHGINSVQVKLTAADDYTVTFAKVRGTSFKLIAIAKNVYAETLGETFREHTGLDNRMVRFAASR
jgi:hypothetical protein